jgi:hypothetical protein
MRFCLAFALSFAWQAAFAEGPTLQLVHQETLEFPRATDFGGLSGLVLSEDGQTAQVINDKGILFELRMKRKDDESIKWIRLVGQRYIYTDSKADTEGLARAENGLFVSFEDPMQVELYEPGTLWPVEHIDFPKLEIDNINRGLEALAIDTEGRLLVLPETVPDNREDFPMFRYFDGIWTEIGAFPATADYFVVGADFGPDGTLFILERAVSLLGFRTRIRTLAAPIETSAPRVLYESHVSQFDNHEGIAVRLDRNGQTRITLISDDNYLSVQKTELLEFILQE